jgi:hypothetical protein
MPSLLQYIWKRLRQTLEKEREEVFFELCTSYLRSLMSHAIMIGQDTLAVSCIAYVFKFEGQEY